MKNFIMHNWVSGHMIKRNGHRNITGKMLTKIAPNETKVKLIQQDVYSFPATNCADVGPFV